MDREISSKHANIHGRYREMTNRFSNWRETWPYCIRLGKRKMFYFEGKEDKIQEKLYMTMYTLNESIWNVELVSVPNGWKIVLKKVSGTNGQ